MKERGIMKKGKRMKRKIKDGIKDGERGKRMKEEEETRIDARNGRKRIIRGISVRGESMIKTKRRKLKKKKKGKERKRKRGKLGKMEEREGKKGEQWVAFREERKIEI